VFIEKKSSAIKASDGIFCAGKGEDTGILKALEKREVEDSTGAIEWAGILNLGEELAIDGVGVL
jgi:hypothetical protein